MSASPYRNDEPESQVRSIIKQLNEERPSQERSREVVVRPDGTKVVRVIKKRKVTITSVEKNRHAKRRFLILLLFLLFLAGGMAAVVSFRMSAMSGESYIQARQEELRQAWGATSVHCTGAKISGFSMNVESLVAEFPESSIIRRVEMRNLRASLATTSFFSGIPESDDLKMDSAVVCLREDVRNFTMPRHEGRELWKVKRVSCDKLSFYVGDETSSPLSVKQASAYMYHPESGEGSRVLILSDGVLQMRGWKPIVITDAKMIFSDIAVDDIHLRGTLDVDKKEQDTASTSISLSGNIRKDADMSGPFAFESLNINFADLSNGRFSQFFNGVTTAERGQKTLSAYMTLPLQRQTPLFSGSFRLKDVRITSFPALMMITDHLEPIRRKAYLPPNIGEATVELLQDEEKATLRIADGNAVERELISLRADVAIDSSNNLSGSVEYGIPSKLTHVEYPDGLADPIFRDDGVYAWLSTTVSGPANVPTDNSAELDAQAMVVRADRPKRIPFDELDVDELSDKMKARAAAVSADSDSSPQQPQPPSEQPALQQQQVTPQPNQPAQESSSGVNLLKLPGDSLEKERNPNSGGLSLPTDDSFFPGFSH